MSIVYDALKHFRLKNWFVKIKHASRNKHVDGLHWNGKKKKARHKFRKLELTTSANGQINTPIKIWYKNWLNALFNDEE